MKRTAQSIEERKASQSNENQLTKISKDREERRQEEGEKGDGSAEHSPQGTRNKKGNRRGMHPNSKKQLKPAPPWPKGTSGNPGGLPGTDLAAVYARRFFEQHQEGVSTEMSHDLKGFNAYAFGVLADRGYGKVKETHEVVGEEGGPVEIVVKLVKA